MFIRNKTKLWTGTIVSALGLFIAYQYFDVGELSHETTISSDRGNLEAFSNHKNAENKDLYDSDASSIVEQTKVDSNNDQLTDKPVNDATNNSSLQYDPLMYSKVRDFKDSRGYFEKSLVEQYQLYSSEILYKLAQEHDILALQTIGKSFESSGDYESAIEFYWKSAVLGSTKAIDDIMGVAEKILRSEQAKGDQNKDSLEEKLLNLAAWNEVKRLRGDPNTGITAFVYERSGIDLSSVDQNRLNERSTFFFESMVKERSQLGLNEFNNEIPDDIEEYITLKSPNIIKFD